MKASYVYDIFAALVIIGIPGFWCWMKYHGSHIKGLLAGFFAALGVMFVAAGACMLIIKTTDNEVKNINWKTIDGTYVFKLFYFGSKPDNWEQDGGAFDLDTKDPIKGKLEDIG